MPGGAQLIGDLLQGAFSSDDINPDDAALAAGYTHKSTTDSQGNVLSKPSYWGTFTSETGDPYSKVTTDPLSELPAKRPSFGQRAFAPSSAAAADSINRSFVANPSLALSNDRTSSLIGARHTALAQAGINSGQGLANMDPNSAQYLLGENPSAQSFESGQTAMTGYRAGVPSAVANNTLANANTGTLIAQNKGRSATTYAAGGGPESEGANDLSMLKLNALQNEGRISNQSAINELNQKDTQLGIGNTDIGLNTLNDRGAQAASDAYVARQLAEQNERFSPQTLATDRNRRDYEEIMSRYGQGGPGFGLYKQSDDSWGYGKTPFSSDPQLDALKAGKGSTVIGHDGKPINVPPPPRSTFVPTGDGTQPTSPAPAPIPMIGNTPTAQTESPDEDKTAVDADGNVWYNGKIIATKKDVEHDKFLKSQRNPINPLVE